MSFEVRVCLSVLHIAKTMQVSEFDPGTNVDNSTCDYGNV
jgi:hypothetical protein